MSSSALPSDVYTKGEDVEYHSSHFGHWVRTKVLDVHHSGLKLKLSCHAHVLPDGRWIKLNSGSVRKVAATPASHAPPASSTSAPSVSSAVATRKRGHSAAGSSMPSQPRMRKGEFMLNGHEAKNHRCNMPIEIIRAPKSRIDISDVRIELHRVPRREAAALLADAIADAKRAAKIAATVSRDASRAASIPGGGMAYRAARARKQTEAKKKELQHRQREQERKQTAALKEQEQRIRAEERRDTERRIRADARREAERRIKAEERREAERREEERRIKAEAGHRKVEKRSRSPHRHHHASKHKSTSRSHRMDLSRGTRPPERPPLFTPGLTPAVNSDSESDEPMLPPVKKRRAEERSAPAKPRPKVQARRSSPSAAVPAAPPEPRGPQPLGKLQKQELQNKIDLLEDDYLEKVLKFVEADLGGDEEEEEINLDLDRLAPERQHQLVKVVDDEYAKQKAREEAKARGERTPPGSPIFEIGTNILTPLQQHQQTPMEPQMSPYVLESAAASSKKPVAEAPSATPTPFPTPSPFGEEAKPGQNGEEAKAQQAPGAAQTEAAPASFPSPPSRDGSTGQSVAALLKEATSRAARKAVKATPELTEARTPRNGADPSPHSNGSSKPVAPERQPDSMLETLNEDDIRSIAGDSEHGDGILSADEDDKDDKDNSMVSGATTTAAASTTITSATADTSAS